jgi:cephalosporin-C deacetylase-like acetyl esterase
VRDHRHAISYVSTLPEVDAARIGVWGSSYSGGHFDAYVKGFEASSSAGRDVLVEHLGG